MLGLWTLLLQKRRNVGLGLIALAICWTMVGQVATDLFSPTGHSLLATRYSYLGNSPIQVARTILAHPRSIFKDHVLEPTHMLYLRKLLAPAGYLPLLAPWMLVLATPTLALNLLSSSPNMYRGDFQYNAEIVPILIFASIEATVLIVWVVRRFTTSLSVKRASREPEPQAGQTLQNERIYSLAHLAQASALALILCFMLARAFNSTRQFDTYSAMPYAHGFHWHYVTAHDRLADYFFAEIPAAASVSTQNQLAPHLSERQQIYLFPYAVDHADYILLDATKSIYPFESYADYAAHVKTILWGGNYGIVDMDDGYLLLKRGYPFHNIEPALKMIDADEHTG